MKTEALFCIAVQKSAEGQRVTQLHQCGTKAAGIIEDGLAQHFLMAAAQRQCQCCRCTFALAALQQEPSAMAFGHAAGDQQAQTQTVGAGIKAIGMETAIKDRFHQFCTDACAGVGDRQQRQFVRFFQAQCHLAAGFGKFEGVADAGYYEAYVCGYSFVYQGFPCSIIGVVIENEQTNEQKQLVKQIVDEMMKTVRNSK